jgi:hypothetical protein
MVQPFDYTLKIPAPGEAFLSGVQIGQQQQQVQAQRARAEAERDKQMRLANFSTELSSWAKNPTPDGWSQLLAKYPDYQQEIMAAQKGADAIERPLMRKLAGDALMAHRNKNPQLVISLIDERIKAVSDSPALVKKLEDMKYGYQTTSSNPEWQEASIVALLAQDEEGSRIYDKAYKLTEPFIVDGGKAYLRGPLLRLGRDVEALMAGTLTTEQFDSTWGKGKGQQYITTGVIDVTPDIPQPTTQAGYDALPPGTEYLDLQGNKKVKKGGQTATPSVTFQGQ